MLQMRSNGKQSQRRARNAPRRPEIERQQTTEGLSLPMAQHARRPQLAYPWLGRRCIRIDRQRQAKRGTGVVNDLIELLQRAAAGDRLAFDAAYAQVYPVLKLLARGAKRRAPHARDANTTSIVNDACLKLLHSAAPNDEAHFYAIAATAMRQILIDRARRRLADKRGGNDVTSLDDKGDVVDPLPGLPSVDVLALDQVLTALALIDPRLAKIVELRCFAELQLDEIGRVLEVSERTARREWRRARAFLLLQLEVAG
jgi:RNA polymerase sigma factor (TIGR02999 family)